MSTPANPVPLISAEDLVFRANSHKVAELDGKRYGTPITLQFIGYELILSPSTGRYDVRCTLTAQESSRPSSRFPYGEDGDVWAGS